jgi:PAN domain-containing protein
MAIKLGRRQFMAALGRAAAWRLAAIILTLLSAVSARADIITMADIARGITMTQAQCAAVPQAVWINAIGRNLCMRFYLSTAGGEGSRPVVFLQGDLGFIVDPKTGAWLVPPDLPDTNTDDLVKYADQMSKKQKTTAIYLARMGRDGSSGWHRQRHTMLEVQATNIALEAIKQRYKFDGFHVYGHSGGGLLVGGLLALRSDIGCAVPADGILAPNPMPKAPDPALQYFDVAAHVAAIAQNRAARIIVITDPQDSVVKPENQTPFVDKLRKAGGQADQFLVEATDSEHHFTTPQAELTISDCLRGAGHDEIAADLAKFETALLASKAKQAAPLPSLGSIAIGVDLYGADYTNFWNSSAEPKLCQDACRSDAKCAAWTFVKPDVQGPQARCWLKSQVPQASKNECCSSGIERPTK